MKLVGTEFIRSLNVEVTTVCNAYCKFCPRRYLERVAEIPKLFFDINKIDELEIDKLVNLKKIVLCGSYGEPVLHPNLFRLLEKLHEKKPEATIYIHTNGAVHSASWWVKLADVLTNINHYVVFGLDGITKEVHEKYRKTNFENLTRNIQAFTDAGGNARIQFFIFKHNEDQSKKFKYFAASLGCHDVQLRYSRRYDSKLEKPQQCEDLESDMNYVEAKGRRYCFTKNGELFIDTQGQIFICCYDYGKYFAKKAKGEEIKKFEEPEISFDNIPKSVKYHVLIEKMDICKKCIGYKTSYVNEKR